MLALNSSDFIPQFKLDDLLLATLLIGDRLSIVVQQKDSGGISQLKLKTDCVEKLNSGNQSLVFESVSSKLENNQKGKILLCHKSSCAKIGGKQLYRALTETLKQLGLQNRVSIELTGCQKQCKKAPSLILMPGKVKCVYVNPNDLTSLLKTHYL
jgi:(2Fe-2S) ferredoxin